MATTPSSTPQDQDQIQIHDSRSPSSPNPISPKPLQSISSLPPPSRKALPWTHQETVNLIQAYQEKWYSLKRGQLKANQWEEVAVTVAARCGYNDPTKTAVQCRHKIEKLRKRFRAEKQKLNPHAWDYFDLMDRMERGPLPISAHPISSFIRYKSDPDDDNDNYNDDGEEDIDNHEDDDDVDEDGYEEEADYGNFVDLGNYNYNNNNNNKRNNKCKSINHIVGGRGSSSSMNSKSEFDRKFGSGREFRDRVLREPVVVRKRKDREESEEELGVGELAAEIKAFAERIVRMEGKKMEMMRETERDRMEMENKRMEMILESQRKIVDTIGRAFGSYQS